MQNGGKWFNAMRSRQGVLLAAASCIWVAWVAGQVFRDVTWVSSMLFYFPSPVLVLVLAGIGAWAWRADRKRPALGMWFLAAVPALFVFGVENRYPSVAPTPAPGGTQRLVHWNVFYGKLGWSGVQRELRAEGADVYVLSEIPKGADIAGLAGFLGPDFAGERMGNLAILARGELENGQWLHRGKGLAVYSTLWRSGGTETGVFVVDLSANVLIPRDFRLTRVSHSFGKISCWLLLAGA
jgi:hypothetical protein